MTNPTSEQNIVYLRTQVPQHCESCGYELSPLMRDLGMFRLPCPNCGVDMQPRIVKP
jgi:predicted RNA-binding Zn-ribbon protein involved in translation (DUF1610 family)